jgi:thiopeptide-type bacteriocin biosynthesis protein
VVSWARLLRAHGEAGNLILDTYYPEAGRYGHGRALDAAEDVFGADSRAAVAGIRHLPRLDIDPVAFAALNMVEIAQGFTSSVDHAIRWLIDRDCPPGLRLDRGVLTQALRLARTGDPCGSAGWPDEITDAWRSRAHALHTYRRSLAPDADRTAILESLLHMHHNRALGIDPDREAGCRRLARQAALAMQAQSAGTER